MFPLRHEFIFVFGDKPYQLNRSIPKLGTGDNRTRVKVRDKDGSMKYRSTTQYHDEPNKKLESVIQITPEKRPALTKHPAVMPQSLAEEYIKALTNENDYVLDCFGGSGTTLFACEKLNRNCCLIEINPDYCNDIIQRWKNK